MANLGRVPLECRICPKQPEFSDISHLLTHVGSKGHLSNYYKLKIRSTHDRNCRRMIEDYDNWYNEWGLEELMSERITLKDRKRNREGYENPYALRSSTRLASNSLQVGRPQRVTLILNHASQSQSQSQSPDRPPRMGYGQSPSAADPILSGGAVKLEHQNVSPYFTGPSTRLSSVDHDTLKIEPDRRSTLRPRSSLRSESRGTYHDNEESLYHENDEGYLIKRHYRRNPRDTFDRHHNNEVGGDPLDTDDGGEGAAKLKGVYWPGMSIFDSATPINRRRRNQKKDESVVDRLKGNSALVERIETTLNADWSVNKERDIDWLPSSSPVPESPRQLPFQAPGHDLGYGFDQKSSTARNDFGNTASRQSRYGICGDTDAESLRSGSHPRGIKRSLSNYRGNKFTSLNRSRRALQRDLGDGEDYGRRIQRRRGSSRAGGQLSFGRPRQRKLDVDDVEEDDEENSAGIHSRKNSAHLKPEGDEEDVLRASELLDPFSTPFGAFGPQINPMMNTNAAIAMGFDPYGVGVISNNQGSMSMESQGDGFPMGYLSTGHLSQFTHRMGLGQYPAQLFGFGMHGFPMNYPSTGVLQDRISPNEMAFSSYGPLAGAGGLWSGFLTQAEQEEALFRFNAGAVERHLTPTLPSNTSVERESSSGSQANHQYSVENPNDNDELPEINVGSPGNPSSLLDTTVGLDHLAESRELDCSAGFNLGPIPHAIITRPVSAAQIHPAIRGDCSEIRAMAAESPAYNSGDKISSEHRFQVRGLECTDHLSENSVTRTRSLPVDKIHGHLSRYSNASQSSLLFQSVHGQANDQAGDADDERTKSNKPSPERY